jgi:hypothetical protein
VTAFRVIAVIAAYNEERFIPGCIEQLNAHGVEVYLLDNDSTDRTVELAERYLGRGVIAIERLPRGSGFSWEPVLTRKTEVMAGLDADWVMHTDPDEVRLPPGARGTLAEAIAAATQAGYNAANFQEFTFVPTVESPDHDHPNFRDTMRWYYPFSPRPLHQVKAWHQGGLAVDLASSGGHRVEFAGQRIDPRTYPVRHYLYLSAEQAVRKYVERTYDAAELARGWHGGRATLTREMITLPRADTLRSFVSDAQLDASDPFTSHLLFTP